MSLASESRQASRLSLRVQLASASSERPTTAQRSASCFRTACRCVQSTMSTSTVIPPRRPYFRSPRHLRPSRSRIATEPQQAWYPKNTVTMRTDGSNSPIGAKQFFFVSRLVTVTIECACAPVCCAMSTLSTVGARGDLSFLNDTWTRTSAPVAYPVYKSNEHGMDLVYENGEWRIYQDFLLLARPFSRLCDARSSAQVSLTRTNPTLLTKWISGVHPLVALRTEQVGRTFVDRQAGACASERLVTNRERLRLLNHTKYVSYKKHENRPHHYQRRSKW